jgi:hypothetical protein
MMSAAYEQYKKRVSNLGIDPLPSGNMFKYACGSPNSQDMTTEEKVKWGKDLIRKSVVNLAQINIKNIPNACQA